MLMKKTEMIFNNESGAGLIEVLLAIGLVAALTPFVYLRVSETSREIRDIAFAKNVMAVQSDIMNYIRLNQDLWDKTAEVSLKEKELDEIFSEDTRIMPYAVFIEKYPIKQGSGFEAYAVFDTSGYAVPRVAKIAGFIGDSAGVVHEGHVAYGVFGDWGASSPDFAAGDLVYRIKSDFSNMSSEKYLHRSSSKGLNEMQRDLSLDWNEIYDIGAVSAKSFKARDLTALFANADRLTAESLLFPNGANLDADKTSFGSIRVNGDLSGFRNIMAKSVGASGAVGWSANADLVADRATVKDFVNVGGNLLLKSSAAKTISGFAGANAHSVYGPFVSATELYFAPGFGITISSELLSSSSEVPIKLGSWSFPSGTAAPRFTILSVVRAGGEVSAALPQNVSEFSKILDTGWKELERR